MKVILYVGSGAATSGDNTSLTPAMPDGVIPGDMVLISAGIRSNTAKVRTPLGWKTLGQHENLSLICKMWRRGDVAPTVSFQGGVAGDTTLAMAHVFRYTNPDVDLALHGISVRTNASAQDISTPALLISDPGCLVVNLALKQDDFTSTSLPGFTTGSQNSSVTGNDAGTVLWTKVQDVAANEPAGLISVTGGAAALSWSMAAAILPYETTWTDISRFSSPCYFAEDFNRVSVAASDRFAEIGAKIDALINPPAARVSVNKISPLAVDPTTSYKVTYDTVDIDPTGMVDLISDPNNIPLPQGVWAFGIAVNTVFSGTEGTVVNISTEGLIGNTSARDLNSTNNPPSGGAAGVSSGIISSGYLGQRSMRCEIISYVGAVTSISYSEMYLFRISD